MTSSSPRRRSAPRPDAVADARRAGRADLRRDPYAAERARQARTRARAEHRNHDPSPPTDEDWTVANEHDDGLRRLSPPTPVGESLARFIESRGWSERLRGADAAVHWERIVGPELAARCEPVRIAGGHLVIRTEQPVLAAQLRYLLPQIEDKARRVLGPGTVIGVSIVVGPLEGRGLSELG